MRVVRTGFGKRLLNSFVAMLLGIVLFFGSFVVLFINEGRENLGIVAASAELFDSTKVYTESDLVYLVGNLSTTTPLQDAYLEDQGFINLTRIVEMYAYVETENSRTQEHVGGSQTTVYTYSYDLQWVNDPRQTSTFKGDSNELPQDIPVAYNTWISAMPSERRDTASNLTIDGISLSSSSLRISNPEPFALTTDDVKATALLANESVQNGTIFRQNSAQGSTSAPEPGDVRIRYLVVTDASTGILFAAYTSSTFNRFTTPDGNTLYRFFTGTTTQSDAVDILRSEYTATLWLLRLVGFLMMFFGLVLMANPARTLLAVVPIFAKVGMFIYGIVAFLVSVVLSTVVIVVSMIFHNVYLAIGTAVLIIIITILVLKRKQAAQPKPKPRKKKT